MTRTNGGVDYMSVQILGGASSADPGIARNIGITNNTTAPSATNVATTTGSTSLIDWGTATATDAAAGNLRGEYTALGFARKNTANITYAHTNGTNTTSMTTTFTATAAFTALQAVGLFTGTSQGSPGTLVAENIFTPTSGVSGDQLTIAWTFTL